MPLLTGILDIHSVAGYGGIKAADCQTKGCCYIPAPATTGAALVTLPACFYPNGGDSSFSLSGALQSSGKLRTVNPHHVMSTSFQLRLFESSAAHKRCMLGKLCCRYVHSPPAKQRRHELYA